jgi:arginyl-tRNA synthetase
MIRNLLSVTINNALQNLAPDAPRVQLDVPTNAEFGDFSTSVAMTLARQLKQNPLDIANALVERIRQDVRAADLLESISVAPPGFINLKLATRPLLDALESLQSTRSAHPDAPGRGQTVMVEYSSPNIAKPFNVGHLRSTIIGDSLANVYDYLGYKVIRDNHLGDWGTQYGKLAYAVEKWGDWQAIVENPIPELFALYVRINDESKDDPQLQEEARDYFKRLEEGDPHVRKLWQKLSDLSMADFSALYERFGIHFDVMLGESFYEPYLKDITDECVRAGVASESQGAIVINFDDPKLQNPPLMIRKSNGTTTYATRDLAGIKYRFNEFKLDKLIIEIGNEQEFYFRQIIAAAEKMGWIKPGQLVHVGHGLFLGNSGKKLSTRRGETVWLKELVAELEDKAVSIVSEKSPDLSPETKKEIASIVAVGALKYNDLSQNRLSNIVFDKNKALSLDGNSAPYLQYTIARARSVLRQADGREAAPSGQFAASERALVLSLMQFDSAVEQVARDMFPSHIATLMFQIAQQFNAFYQAEPILKASEMDRGRRLALVNATTHVLSTGLRLLGISVPERM